MTKTAEKKAVTPDPFYMTKSQDPQNPYNPRNPQAPTPEVLYMTKIPTNPWILITPGGGENWIFGSSGAWTGTWSSASWTNTAGSFAGAHDIFTAPAGYTKVKIQLNSGYWRNSSHDVMYVVCVKSVIDSAVGAVGGSVTIDLDGSRQWAVGFYDPTPASCSNTVYYWVYYA
jgi:hypothetical protein